MQTLQITLTLEEVNLILEALGELPFRRVHLVVSSIQQQATAQLSESRKPAAEENSQTS
jgi:hypothetical protein